jgi:carbonic anhydrase
MEKIFHFDSPLQVYTADACVISCFDARFDVAIRKFLKRLGILVYDNIRIPGSAQALVSPPCENDRDFVLRMIETSIRLHHSPRVVILGHADCGGYPSAPNEAVIDDLWLAAKVLKSSPLKLPVECYFADFDGIYQLK